MDKEIKAKLTSLESEVLNNNDLSEEEKNAKLEDIKYAKYLLGTKDDFKYQYEDSKGIDEIKSDTILNNREKLLNSLKTPEKQKYTQHLHIGTKEVSINSTMDNLDVQKEILNNYEFKSSPEFKEKLVKIVNKLNEYDINDSRYAGESGDKIYSFYKYKNNRDEMYKAVLKGDLDKVGELHRQSVEIIDKYTELLDMAKDISPNETVDNLDIKREKFYVPEIYNRQVAASNLNGIFQISCFCKSLGISVEEYLENPIKHSLSYLSKTAKESRKSMIAPKDATVNQKLITWFDIQVDGAKWGNISGTNTAAMYNLNRSLEVLIKLDKGEGEDSRLLVGALMNQLPNLYNNTLLFSGVYDEGSIKGVKGALLAGQDVENISMFDPNYINYDTLEKSPYKYEDILNNLTIDDDIFENTIRTYHDFMRELKDAKVKNFQTMSPEGGLYLLTDYFGDLLQREDVLANKELCAKLYKFLQDPVNEFNETSEALGKEYIDLNPLSEFTPSYKLPSPVMCTIVELNSYYKDFQDNETLTGDNLNFILKGLKTIEINDKLRGERPKFPHLIDRYRYDRDLKLSAKLKDSFKNKLNEFGYSDEKIDLMVHNNDARRSEYRAIDDYEMIKMNKFKEDYDKAFNKGSLDDLTPEQKDAYLNQNVEDYELLQEANTILGGIGINSENLKTAMEIYNTVKKTPNGQELAKYIKEDLMEKGLSEELFSQATEENANIEDVVGTMYKEPISIDMEEETEFKLEGFEEDLPSKEEDLNKDQEEDLNNIMETN